MATLLTLHGPNLNLLGTREPQLYGTTTLDDINRRLDQVAKAEGHRLLAFQSNAEHDIVDRIQQAPQDNVAFILINPGAFTHTSIAIRDALAAVAIPFIEIHISNIYQRESFRRRSYLSDVAKGVICGLGVQGYELALRAAMNELKE